MNMQRFVHLLKLQFLCAFVLAILVCPFARELAGAGSQTRRRHCNRPTRKRRFIKLARLLTAALSLSISMIVHSASGGKFRAPWLREILLFLRP